MLELMTSSEPNEVTTVDDGRVAEGLTAEEGFDALQAEIVSRRAAYASALRAPDDAVVLGASNMPHDCSIWAADWREALPEGHPDRGSTLVREQADDTLRLAHRALLGAARRTGNAGPLTGLT